MQSNVPSPATSPADSEHQLQQHQQKSSWSGYHLSLSDLFPKPSSSTISNSCTTVSSISHLTAASPYLGKMTNSGQRTQTVSRESCSNNLSLCQPNPVHEIQGPFASSNSPLVSHSESESPVDLHLYPFAPSSAVHPSKLCIHHNLFVKCATCNPSYSSLLRSVNKLNPSPESHYGSLPSSQLDLQNKLVMNSLNPEALLSSDKHLFGPASGSGMGLGGNPLGHLGHISTSIAAGISSGVNPGLSMASSHLHPSHHHPSSHQATLHSMSTPGFSLHSHLGVAPSGPRRMSGTSNPNRVTKNPVNTKQFLCPMCNKLFTQKGNLKTHMMIHTGDKPYACHVCGKSFTQKGNVDTHIKIHTGVKDYSCESCGKSFTQKGNLKTHVRSVHTKEKPYACSVCGKSFSQKGNMHTHIRTHNKDDRFPCNLCGKTFSQKGNLKTHMQRHAGTLPKRYGPGGQRRQTTSRLLQVPVSAIGGAQSAAAAAAAAAYAIAAAGNVTNLERGLHQPQSQLSRHTPVSPDGGDDSRSPSSLVHGPSPLNGAGAQQRLAQQQQQQQQQSVISNVQNQQPSREHQAESRSLYPVSSDNSFVNSMNGHNLNSVSHMQSHNPPNSFNLATTPSAAAAAAAVLLSSTSSFSKDPKTNHLHFMSSLFH